MTTPSSSPPSVTATNLSRLLSRLGKKLTSSTPSDPVITLSSLERKKITANLGYAHKLLLQLEHESSDVPAKQRPAVLEKLSEQKLAVRRLTEKLHLSVQETEVEVEDDETDEEMDVKVVESDEEDYQTVAPVPATSLPVDEDTMKQQFSPPSTLRNRFPTQREERAALFSRGGDPADGEAQLNTESREQENLTEDMLSLARALKENSIRFGQELDKEKGLLDLAGEGLDKNARGIEGAGRKMDVLRKDENVSSMWAIIYSVAILGLAFFTFFIMFFAPKLRW